MALEQAGLSFIAENVNVYISNVSNAEKANQSFYSSLDAGASHAGGFQQVITGALREIGKVAVDALGQAAKATASFVKDSISTAGNFQQEFAQFQIAVGHTLDGSGKSLNDFKALFISLGKELPVSTGEVEQAAVEMARGGIDPAVIAAGGLRQTIQFASAALKGDLVSAAQISAKTMQAWTSITDSAATKTDFLTHAQNLMTQATTAASTTVDQLFLGLSNVGGTARLAGVSFDETVKALAQLTPSFASSADAGTSLKTFFARLQPTTKPAIAAMQELGLWTEKSGSAFYDAKGNFIGMQAAEDLLQKSTVNLTNAQREMKLQTIFGQDSIRAAGVFALQGQVGYDALSASIAKQTTLTDAAKINQDTYNTAVENAKGSVEALQITLGSQFLPILTDLFNNTIAPGINTITTFTSALFGNRDAFASLSTPLQDAANYITNVVKAFEGWESGTLSLKTALDVVTPGLGQVVDLVQELSSFLTENIGVIEGVAAALGTLAILSTVSAGVSGLITAALGLATAFGSAGGGIAGVVAILGGPVTLAIAGVAAAIGLLVVAWTNDWGGIQEKVADAWASIQPALATLSDWLETHIPQAISTASDYFNKNIFPVLKDLSDIYLAAASAELKLMADVWENVVSPALSAAWTILKDDIIPIIAALVNVNIAALKLALTAMAGIWQKEVQPALTAAGTYISANLGPTLKGVGDWMSSTFGPTLQNISKWLSDVTGGFSGMSGAVQGVSKYLNDLATSISTLKLPPWATPGSPTPWEIALRGIGDALSTEVIPGVNAFGQSLSGMATAAGSAAADITGNLSAALKGSGIINDAKALGKNAIAGLVSGMEANMKAIDKVADKAADKVKSAFAGSFDSHSPAGITIPFGASLVDGLVLGLQSTIPSLTSMINQMDSAMIASFAVVDNNVREQVSKITDGLMAQIKSAQDAIGNLKIAGFGSTANIDKQKLSNLDALGDVTAGRSRTEAQARLEDAQREAAAINDPKQAADYFQMRSEQIIKLAKLQDAFQSATDADAKAAALARYQITEDQISAERQQFSAQQAQGSDTSDLITQLQSVLSSSNTLNGQNFSLPGLLDNPVMGQIYSLLNQLTTPTAPQYIGGTPASNNYAATTNINMPVYTNQSPAVMQQSMAIIGAGLA